MSWLTIANLLAFTALLAGIAVYCRRSNALSKQVLAGLVAGLGFGIALQLVYGTGSQTVAATLEWTNVVGSVYVSLLRMLVMPLILAMMVAAVVRMREIGNLGRIGGLVIGILVGTTTIAAFIGIFVTSAFGLTAEGLTAGARELAGIESMQLRQEALSALGLSDMLVSFFPDNIFYDLTGARSTSIIAVVIFGALFGVAALLVSNEDPARGATIMNAVETLRAIVLKLVHIVMRLTPYGILALMTNVVASSNGADILNLLTFIVASYLAIGIMFVVHALLLRASGTGLGDYFSKVWPLLTFAFGSRSSAAAIPLNVDTQVEKLGVPQHIASFAASFGATIGQNGCAGIYPAMLATMIAPTVGVDPLEPAFMFTLVAIVTISSFGIAGVGGGATVAALVVLPAIGFPITLAALLISIEPLIDMARTALNVNGTVTAGVLTGKILKPDRAAT